MIELNLLYLLGWGIPAMVTAILALRSFVKHAAKKAVDHAFNRDLESHKAQLQKAGAIEMERVKAGWSAELSRHGKLLDREFDALPTAWDKINEALGATVIIASRGKEYPSVLHANNDELDEVLANIKVPESQKDEVRREASPLDRQKLVYRLVDAVRAHDALNKIYAARNYLIAQSIFIDKETYKAMLDLLDLTVKAAYEEQFNVQYPPGPGERREREACEAFLVGRDALLTVAETRVRERLGTLAKAED